MDIIEAYKKICQSDYPYRCYEILNSVERGGLNIPDNAFDGMLPRSLQAGARALVQQTLLRSARQRIMQPLLCALADGKNSYAFPLPAQWLDILYQQSVAVDRTGSLLLFLKEQARAWLRAGKGMVSLLRCCFKSYDIDQSYVMYPDLSASCCEKGDNRKNFIRWLADNGEHKPEQLLCVTYRQTFQAEGVRYCPYIFPRLATGARISFMAESLYLYLVAALKWAGGAWYMPFIIHEIAAYAYFKRIDRIADRYAFSNSSYAVRPLWTYAAQARGSEIILYFYSGNTNVFYKGQTSESPPTPGYMSMTWPAYWVIDEDQKQFLTRQCGISAPVQVKGYMDYTDSGGQVPDDEKPVIALFDIPIYNIDYIAPLGIVAPYYTHDIISQFIEDVISVAADAGFQVYWKTKRNMSGNTKISGYNALIKRYENHPNVTLIDPDVAAKRVMDHADVAVAIPFTSALLSNQNPDKLCLYYDPTGSLDYFSGLARNFPVIKTKDDLKRALIKFITDEQPFDKQLVTRRKSS